MKPTNLTIKDLFADDAKLTFLVGAGCSIGAPSCLPAGRSMMEAIIKYTCAESEIEKILDLEQLRFEGLVEIVRDRLDHQLKIIDYYGEADKPNVQHFFLAEMIKKGHFVITTNFDFLIEYALLQSNVPKGEVILVITKKDFEEYNNPNELFERGKKTVYKIHGSTKNVIAGENTKESLIATIQAFGSNKEGLNVFQIQPFQRGAFDNVSNGRSLVVMGYSGSDDFDVVPTLMVLKNLKNIVWINHFSEEGCKVYEIDESTAKETESLDKINRILVDLKRTNNANHIYRVDANTTMLIKELLEIEPELSLNNFSISPTNWLKNNVNPPDEFEKYFIPYKIYNSFDILEDALRCTEKILRIAEEKGDKKWILGALNNIGLIYYAQGNYPEALKSLEEALKIFEQLDSPNARTIRENIEILKSKMK